MGMTGANLAGAPTHGPQILANFWSPAWAAATRRASNLTEAPV
jgi:hypothetical protein